MSDRIALRLRPTEKNRIDELMVAYLQHELGSGKRSPRATRGVIAKDAMLRGLAVLERELAAPAVSA